MWRLILRNTGAIEGLAGTTQGAVEHCRLLLELAESFSCNCGSADGSHRDSSSMILRPTLDTHPGVVEDYSGAVVADYGALEASLELWKQL
jgi:hypothetical protein